MPFLAALRVLQASPPMPGARVTVAAGDRTLEAGLLRNTAADQWVFRLTERHEGEDKAMLAAQHGLTSREAEVLLWVSYGKSSGDISDVLEISPRTVQKHLEHVYEKLGVETRSAAAAIAIRMIEQ